MINLKKHVLFQDAAVIKKACIPLKDLSIDGFIFMRRFFNGTFVNLSNQLEWSESFLTRYLDCKVNLNSAQKHMMIKPGLSLWSHDPFNTIYLEGREQWGFYSGIIIAKEGPCWNDIFYYYSRKNPFEMDSEYLNNFQLLEKFNLFFVEKFQDVIKKGEKNPLVNPAIYLQNENSKNEIRDKFLQDLNGREYREPLSTRELECIYYISKGNTAAKVGEILHISRRTVETHLQKAKNKLRVTKTSALIKFFPNW